MRCSIYDAHSQGQFFLIMHDMARPNVHLSCTQKKYVHRLVPRLFITVAAAESLIDFQLNTAFVAR